MARNQLFRGLPDGQPPPPRQTNFSIDRFVRQLGRYVVTPLPPEERPASLLLVFVGRLLEADIRCMWWYGTLVACRSLFCRALFLWVFGVAAIVGALVGTVAALLDECLRTVPFITSVCVLWVIIIAPYADFRFAVSRYRKRSDEYLETRVTLTQDRVAIENASFRTEFGWKLIAVVADSREGMLFCGSNYHALFWLPERVLGGDQGREQLRMLLELSKVRVRKF